MTKINCLGIIPVRLESTRLPNKPLKDINGKTLVQRVWEQAKKCTNLSYLAIATNSDEIAQSCKKNGAPVIMTGSHNETGTDRVAEACKKLSQEGKNFDLVVNIQGDMPFINPKVIDSTIMNLHNSDSSFGMCTIATPITSKEEYERSASVKIALGEDNLALYFSRSPIPHWRNMPHESSISPQNPYSYKHMGLYAYRHETLMKLSSLARAFTEQREGLEQLRALAHGIKIKVNIIPRPEVEPAIEVDTPEDLERAIQYAKKSN